MRLSVLLCLLASALTSPPVGAQSCPPAADRDAPRWRPQVDVPSVLADDSSVIQLTRADGEAIRCAVLAALASDRLNVLPNDMRQRVNQNVGAPWMDGSRPRIGGFWLQQTSSGELELADTLFMNERVRYALVVRVAQQNNRWVVTNLSSRIDHAR